MPFEKDSSLSYSKGISFLDRPVAGLGMDKVNPNGIDEINPYAINEVNPNIERENQQKPALFWNLWNCFVPLPAE